MQYQQPFLLAKPLMVAVVVGFAIWGFVHRPKINVQHHWILTLLVLPIAAIILVGTQHFPAPAWAVALAVLTGCAAGTLFGRYSGMRRTVRTTEKRGVILGGGSWKTLAVGLTVFIVTSFLHVPIPHRGAAAIAVDGALAFGFSTLLASNYMLYARYR